jgi:hypothetical protein
VSPYPQAVERERLDRLLGFVKAYNGWFTLALAIFIVAAANVVVVGVLHADMGIGAELGLEVLIVIIGLAVPLALILLTLWPELKVIFGIVSDAPPKATPILLRFVREEMKLLGDRITDTRSRGIDLDGNVVTPWVRDRCFAVATGPYRGTDSLLPSRFLATYSAYLRQQAEYLKRTECTASARINLAPAAALERDREEHPEEYRRYEAWHRENNVELLHLEEDAAQLIALDAGLKDTTDLAIWVGEVALLVDYRPDGTTNLRLALVGESSYRRAMFFFDEALAEARPFASLRQPSR